MMQLAAVLLGLAMLPAVAAADDQQWTVLKPHGDRIGTLEPGISASLIIRDPSGHRIGTIEHQPEIGDLLRIVDEAGKVQLRVERIGERLIIRKP